MKLNNVVLIIGCIIVLISCSNDNSIVNSEIKEEITNEVINSDTLIEVIEESEEEINKYKVDFENYKLALEENDTSFLYRYNESDETDIETLLMLFSDPFFMDALKNTEYKELTKVKRDEQELLEFSVQQIDYDEEGNEVGAAVFLYFKESKNKLLLHSYLAAG